MLNLYGLSRLLRTRTSGLSVEINRGSWPVTTHVQSALRLGATCG